MTVDEVCAAIEELSPDEVRRVWSKAFLAFRSPREPAVPVLATFKVGESRIVKLPRLYDCYRKRARTFLKDDSAMWISKTTTKGLRVTRVK